MDHVSRVRRLDILLDGMKKHALMLFNIERFESDHARPPSATHVASLSGGYGIDLYDVGDAGPHPASARDLATLKRVVTSLNVIE